MSEMAVVSYEDFKKLDLRVVKPVKAEAIPGRGKILKLTVDVGSGETRTMIAGGAEYYKPESFLEKKFIALINLAPKTIAGVASQGMLLAADVNGKPVWLMVEEDAPAGSQIT